MEKETLEEAAERLHPTKIESCIEGKIDVNTYERNLFIAGARWQQEKSYTEEEVGELVYNIIGQYGKHYGIMIDGAKLNELFEQFKKK